MKLEYGNIKFKLYSDYGSRFLLKIDETLMKLIANDHINTIRYLTLLVYLFRKVKRKDSIVFLRIDDETQQEYERFDRCIKRFFDCEFNININSVKDEVRFIPIEELMSRITDEGVYKDTSMKYLFNTITAERYSTAINDVVEIYGLFPIKIEWIKNYRNLTVEPDSGDQDRIYQSTPNVNLFMDNQIFRKYSLENDVKFYNKEGTKTISIEDDKSPMFMIVRDEERVNNIIQQASKEKDAYYINPNMARIFKANTLNIELMLNMMGYHAKEMIELIRKVANKKLSISIIGLGGTMSNFVYFTTELAKLARLDKNVFKEVAVFDDDLLEVSNLPRIPLDYISHIFTTKELNHHKVNMLYNVNGLGDNVITSIKKIRDNYRLDKNFNWIIGTPDLNTRTFISDITDRFICPMHSDNELYIYIAPKLLGADLMFETYGRIRLSKFFFNMLEMTIQCLKIMLENNIEGKEGQMVHQYSIDNVDIENNLKQFKRKERVII